MARKSHTIKIAQWNLNTTFLAVFKIKKNGLKKGKFLKAFLFKLSFRYITKSFKFLSFSSFISLQLKVINPEPFFYGWKIKKGLSFETGKKPGKLFRVEKLYKGYILTFKYKSIGLLFFPSWFFSLSLSLSSRLLSFSIMKRKEIVTIELLPWWPRKDRRWVFL